VLTRVEISRVRIGAETSWPSTRVHGCPGSPLTSIAGVAAPAATAAPSSVSTPWETSHQVSARYMAPVSR
jgi:hypothetical protein